MCFRTTAVTLSDEGVHSEFHCLSESFWRLCENVSAGTDFFMRLLFDAEESSQTRPLSRSDRCWKHGENLMIVNHTQPESAQHS